MSDFDPFNLKASQRQCPRCEDGRLNSEPIGDLKVNLYCDTCNFRHLYTRDPEPRAEPTTGPAPDPTPASAPAPTLTDATMPRQPDPDMNKTQLARWRNAGKPDREKFIAAGCPTPTKWAKLQGAKPAKSNKPSPKPRSSKKKAVAPTPHTNITKPLAEAEDTTRCSLSIKAVSISFEGEAADLTNLISSIVNAIQ